MSDDIDHLLGRPDILLMLQEGLPSEIEFEFREEITRPGLKVAVVRSPGGPYAGVELYLPSAIGLFIAAGFFNGFLQEIGKDAYVILKATAISLWKRASQLKMTTLGSHGKVGQARRFSLAYSITSEIIPELKLKLVVKNGVDIVEAEAGIEAFVELVDDLLNDRISDNDINALLAYKPSGGLVLVTFDATIRKIVAVNAFESLGS